MNAVLPQILVKTLKIIKYFVLSLSFLSIYAFAGQGVYMFIRDHTNAPLTLKVDSKCVDGTGDIAPNRKVYLEASQSGICFFEKSYLYMKLFSDTTLIANYTLNVSAYGSSLIGDLTVEGRNRFIEESMLYPHSGLSGSQDLVEISISNSVDDWLSQMSAFVAHRPINKVPVPGSHDTGTYSVSKSSFITPDASELINVIGNTLFISNIIGWSKTQNLNVEKQLERGIRYLDLRLCGQTYNNEQVPLTTCHSLSADSFENIFRQTAEFLNNPKHKHEIVFLDINHSYNVNANQIEILRNLALTYFGDKIASPTEFSSHNTYEDLWNAHKQVILFWSVQGPENDLIAPDDSLFWSATTIESNWPNKQNIYDLKSSLNNIIQRRDENADNFFVLQTQLTPSTDTILNGLFIDSAPNSLLEFSNYKTDMDLFLRSPDIFNQMKFKGNIIIQDFSNGIDLVAYCKKLILDN